MNQKSTLALRIAAVMQTLGIESFPRNYELVYEVYSGNNVDLARDFVALGKEKNQRALDELGRKYLPHQHEKALFADSSDKLREQVTNFLELIKQEQLSLTDFSEVVRNTSQTVSSAPDNKELLRSALDGLLKATETQVTKSQTLSSVAEQQEVALLDLESDLQQIEQMKFVDALTGFANRRAFNRAVATVYAGSGIPQLCGLAFCAIDNFKRFEDGGDMPFANDALKFVARQIGLPDGSSDLVARTDGNMFAFIYATGDPNEVVRLVESARAKLAKRSFISPKSGITLGKCTTSFGIAMSEDAKSVGEWLSNAEGAINLSRKAGGNCVTLYSKNPPSTAPKDWTLYRS